MRQSDYPYSLWPEELFLVHKDPLVVKCHNAGISELAYSLLDD